MLYESKQKVHFIMDYSEFNVYVDAYIPNANICTQKL